MRAKSLFQGFRSAVMIWLSLGALLGCTYLHDYFPPELPTLPNADAVDRALQLCALTHGEEPFHLKMQIRPPAESRSAPLAPEFAAMQAEIELWWLNPITYRTEIRSAIFRQTRIVNGGVIEEQNLGPFYPRWIQNFLDALFDPVPHLNQLRREPGAIPVSQESHACISHKADETATAQICFQGKEPLLASSVSFNRYVAFDNFAAFGRQLIPRTLINDLPANTLIRGEVLLLEPLPQTAYPLLKAWRATSPYQQIRTQLVSSTDAQAMLLPSLTTPSNTFRKLADYVKEPSGPIAKAGNDPILVYIRTDRSGRVREAYTDRNDIYNQHQNAVARAFQLRFRPLIVNGAAQQMEAPIEIR
ncbi:MAG TPA: hypothetical protein VL346_12215 [Acidobacteriaceae bacterium]|nr:hypothetical protein [Acidobacteriaceae bacterium]